MWQRLKGNCGWKTQKQHQTESSVHSKQHERKNLSLKCLWSVGWCLTKMYEKKLIDSFKEDQSKLTRCVPDTRRPCGLRPSSSSSQPDCPQKNEHDCWNLVRMVEQNHWIPGYVLMFLVGVDLRDLSLLWNVLFWQWSRTDHSRPSDPLVQIFFDVQHDVQCVAQRRCTSSDQERSVYCPSCVNLRWARRRCVGAVAPCGKRTKSFSIARSNNCVRSPSCKKKTELTSELELKGCGR